MYTATVVIAMEADSGNGRAGGRLQWAVWKPGLTRIMLSYTVIYRGEDYHYQVIRHPVTPLLRPAIMFHYVSDSGSSCCSRMAAARCCLTSDQPHV